MATKKATRNEARDLSPEVADLLNSGWQQASGGAGEPWTPGLVIVGEYRGVRDSQFVQDDGEHAKLVDLSCDDGPRVMRCPTVLANRLADVGLGDTVRIECHGKIKTSAGRQAWDFTVLCKRVVPRPEQQSLALSPVAKRKPGRKGSK